MAHNYITIVRLKMFNIHLINERYIQWTQGPGTRDPGTQGPRDPGTRTQIGIHCMHTYIVHT